MSGRGRELTLPSWMTNEAGPQMSATVPVVPVVAPVAPIVTPILSPLPGSMPAPPQPPVLVAKPVTLAPSLSMPMPTMSSLFPMAMGGIFPGVAASVASSEKEVENIGIIELLVWVHMISHFV